MRDLSSLEPSGSATRQVSVCASPFQAGATRCRARGYLLIKHAVEWCAALVMLVFAIPILFLLAIALKLTSEGPVCYSQMRLGRHGRPFRIYKLRTMKHRCEATTGPVWSIYPDPRITRIGRWLRDTHLDELPQLWNVLRGDMTLIGPRPERPEIAEVIECRLPAFRDRLLVRPGITGLAQVRLPSDTSLDTVRQKLVHDLHYIRRIGPMMDLRIALSTGLHFVGAAASAVSARCVQSVCPTISPAMSSESSAVSGGLHLVTEVEVDADGTRAMIEHGSHSRAA